MSVSLGDGRRPHDSPYRVLVTVAMSHELLHIKGRAAGACDGRSGRPRFTGTIDKEGRVRIDCENYPEHWQEFQLPEEWVLAYHAHNKAVEGLLSTETLQDKVVVHADQAWVVDEADPGCAGLHRKLTSDKIESAIARNEPMYDAVQLMVFSCC